MTTTSVKNLPSSILGPEISAAPEDHPFRQEFRGWLAENSPGLPEPLDQDEKFELRRAWQRTLFEGGWAGPAWPEKYGGRGTGPLHQFMYYEELALARAPHIANTPGISLLGPTLIDVGSEELKERFLPSLMSAEEIFCQGFSEPNAGSDLAAIRGRAELEGDEWVINGQKIWTTWAQYSDFCFVLCRTLPGSERHKGLTLLICPMDQEGVTVRPIEQISGDPEFAEVFFDDARCPAGYAVGGVDDGWTTAMILFQYERGDQGFTDHSRMLVKLHDIATDLREPATAGRISTQASEQARRRLAALWIRCQQLRRFNLGVAVRGEAGEAIGMQGSVVNLFWGELEREIGELGAEVHGARGLLLGTEPAHEVLATRAGTIHSGTSEIQRNIIAERLLGLPQVTVPAASLPLRRSLVFATDELEPLATLARGAEAAGLDRVWTTEYVGRDAVARALAVALATERIEVATGITYAFTRVPLAMAALAADVQRLSGGRFALGVSSGTRGVRRWYGAEFEPPAPAIENYAGALREAWAKMPDLDQPPPVYGAVLNPVMTRYVARSCDGALLHALALSRTHLHERVLPAIAEGLAQRSVPGELELAAWCITAIDEDEERARELARRQLAFYLSTPSYRTVAEGTDWESVATAVREAFDASERKAAWGELSHLIPDHVVDELTISGTPAIARERAAALEAELAAAGVTELVFQTAGADVSAAELISNCEQIAEVLGSQAKVSQ